MNNTKHDLTMKDTTDVFRNVLGLDDFESDGDVSSGTRFKSKHMFKDRLGNTIKVSIDNDNMVSVFENFDKKLIIMAEYDNISYLNQEYKDKYTDRIFWRLHDDHVTVVFIDVDDRATTVKLKLTKED